MRRLLWMLPLAVACNAEPPAGDDSGGSDDCDAVCASTTVNLSFADDLGPIVPDSVEWQLDGGGATDVDCPEATCVVSLDPVDGVYTFNADYTGLTETGELTLLHPAGDACCPGVLDESLELFWAGGEAR